MASLVHGQLEPLFGSLSPFLRYDLDGVPHFNHVQHFSHALSNNLKNRIADQRSSAVLWCVPIEADLATAQDSRVVGSKVHFLDREAVPSQQ